MQNHIEWINEEGRHVCRHQAMRQGMRRGGRRPFAAEKAEPRYAPDLPFRARHLKLDLTLDPIGKKAQGSVEYTLQVVSPDSKQIRLDQEQLQVASVTIAGHAAEYRCQDRALWIDLPAALGTLKEGQEISLKVNYEVQDPRRGLYFTGPDSYFTGKPHQVWSQGQDQDNHYWFPAFDYPNQRMTVESVIKVPKDFTAVCNGALVSSKTQGLETVFHYQMNEPIVTYLVTLVVGKFTAWKDKGPNGLPIEYYVVPGREDDGRRSFSNTPQMIDAFSKRLGVDYPYAKYSQVAVQDFIFGGMENASATTQTDLTLHDERAHLDFTSDPLVSHELAHQWFGDLLTCRDWSHAWLNEGFATFMERVWIESHTGPHGGVDEAKYYSYQDFKDYLSEDSDHYRRPIVSNLYQDPIDIFDRHLYQKGGLVLNLLRSTLGDESFWKSIRLYVTRHRNQAVETIDLIRAIEDATGRNMRRFFDEWVFGAGHPELEIAYTWHEDTKKVELVIEQKQTGGKPFLTEQGVTTHLFHLSADIEMHFADGSQSVERVELKEARERVFFSVPSQPKRVGFDPGGAIPKSLKWTRPKELALEQLKSDADCMLRIEAAQELGKISTLESVAALKEALLTDVFWGVQAEAAHALGEIRLDAARDALIGALGGGVKNPKSRKAVVQALAKFKDSASVQALRAAAEKDPSYFVEAEATIAFATASLRGSLVDSDAEVQAVEDFLLNQIKKQSYREVIQKAAYRALSNLPGVASGKRPLSLEALVQGAQPGRSPDSRAGAIAGLGRVASRSTPEIASRMTRVLSELADEKSFFVRTFLVGALEESGLPEAISILRRIHASETDGRIKRHSLWAVETIQQNLTSPEAVGQLRKDLETLQGEHQKMRSFIEEIRAERGK